MDTEGTGVIKRDQIEILMRALGHSPSPQELASKDYHSPFFCDFYSNSFNPISEHKEADLKTFMEIMPRKRTLISKDAVKKAMAVLEKHGNGKPLFFLLLVLGALRNTTIRLIRACDSRHDETYGDKCRGEADGEGV